MHRPIITLTTDFGSSGPYVAAVKGVILGINPAASIVDVSHEVGAQNIREAALVLAHVAPYFPKATIHVVAVDPGVGSSRRLLGISASGQFFLGPDNGVLSWAAREPAPVELIELTEQQFWLSHASATFHGRDILAPVAAHLSRGVSFRELGRPTSHWEQLPWPKPTPCSGGLQGEVLAIDRFGNLITNINETDLPAGSRHSARVRCGGVEIGPLLRTYSDASDGGLLALIGSSSLLEIAARNGSAANKLGCAADTPVQVIWGS